MSGQRFGLAIAAVIRRGYHPTNPILSACVCPDLPDFLLSLPVSEDNALKVRWEHTINDQNANWVMTW